MFTERDCKRLGMVRHDTLEEFRDARRHLLKALQWMLETENLNERYAGASQFLKAFGIVFGAHYLLKGASKSKNLDRVELAQFYIDHILPESYSALKSACRGASSLYNARI